MVFLLLFLNHASCFCCCFVFYILKGESDSIVKDLGFQKTFYWLIFFFREGGQERERNINLFPLIQASIGSFLYVLTGHRTCTLGLAGRHSNPQRYPARACWFVFKECCEKSVPLLPSWHLEALRYYHLLMYNFRNTARTLKYICLYFHPHTGG